MTQETEEGTWLWSPSEASQERTRIRHYQRWLSAQYGLSFDSYHELWQWSVNELEAFWESLWKYFDVRSTRPYTRVLSSRAMPGARWFEGALLNYTEHALRRSGSEAAVVFAREAATPDGALARGELSWDELREQVARARTGLAKLGVGRGDCVAAFLPNSPEALVAFLATASLGAVWSSCSPEFGAGSVLDRFSQISPKLLLAVDGYRYGGKDFDCMATVQQIAAGLPTLRHSVLVTRLGAAAPSGMLTWRELLAESGALAFEPVPFDHPLWIVYSSGTTGLPKPIVHGQGGVLLEHLKALALHCDLGETDRFFWFSTTGWMMWNFLVGGLLVSSCIVLYEGNPGHPDLTALFRFAEAERVTYFGTSAPFLVACQKAGVVPKDVADLSSVRAIGSTGAPLPAAAFGWVYAQVKSDVLLGSISGGTDVCTAFVSACPLLPVHAGEIQCAALGVNVQAFDASGQPLVGEVGELVITEPMPSMPIYFLNDPDGRRFRESYFEEFPGVWRHADWVKLTARGSAIIYGRSDSTLNRGGVRMGTAEFYRFVEALPEVADSLVVDTGAIDREGKLWLFVVPAAGTSLSDEVKAKLRTTLRKNVSPRHVPDEIVEIPAVPRTLSGKKLEVPVKRLLMGVPAARAVNLGTLVDPQAIDQLLRAVQRVNS
jgi:acetoacetyl-CoA synthetase